MFRAGERIFLPGGSGEPTALIAPLLAARDIDITTTFVPGVNRLASEMIDPCNRISGLFMQPELSAAQRDGRFRHLPFSYAAMVKWLRESQAFDTCIVQMAPPDAEGRCSLGPAAEFTPLVLQRAARVIAVVNRNVPHVPNAPSFLLRDCKDVVESDTPLANYGAGEPDAASRKIAKLVASRIRDGATLQTGLGKVPNALMAELSARRGLRLHSGMISEGIIGLSANGALDPDWEHVTTAVLGTASLYRWIDGRKTIHLKSVDETHDPAKLAKIDGFCAVNSAVEIDLFGQCNLEHVDGRAISGAGGAVDFARGARLSPNGISIMALPATFGGGKGSRIRAKLGNNGVASLARTEVDMVVTEEGIADLRGLSVHERAEALILVATPAARNELAYNWAEITRKL